MLFPQERQRLETILNLCAEYNKPDLGVGMLGELGPSMDTLRMGSSPRMARRQRGSMDENYKDDCGTSVEVTQQEVRNITVAPRAFSG